MTERSVAHAKLLDALDAELRREPEKG